MPRLRPFQREDVDRIKQAGLRCLLASAQGTGKTPIAIRALAETYRRSLPAIVVCPASVILNWEREFRRWAPGVGVVQVGRGPIPRPQKPTVYILSWARLSTRCDDLLRLRPRTLIGDECHFVRHPTAQRSQAFYYLAARCPYVLGLTGTPIVNTKIELGVLKSIFGEDKPLMIRRLLEDIAEDIPPKTRSHLYIDLRAKHRMEYDRADDDFEQWLRREKEKLLGEGLAEYEVERAMAAEALAKIGYLRRLLGTYKVPAALDWLARAVRVGEPVVVFVEHQDVLHKLCKGLRKQRILHGVVEGKTPPKKRQQIIDAFQRNAFPIFIGTKAAKEGITLTAARHVLFVERFFTAAEEEQGEDRCYRIGQRHPTTIWYLHAIDSVDDRLDTIVRTKRQVVRTAIGSADIVDTPSRTVASLMHMWNEHVDTQRKVLPLGLGDRLPPLPRPRTTHSIVFYGERWRPKVALAWCRMNGYRPMKLVPLDGRFKLVQHPAEVFQPHRFSVVPISKDIRIIQGVRLSPANERRIRRSLRAAR